MVCRYCYVHLTPLVNCQHLFLTLLLIFLLVRKNLLEERVHKCIVQVILQFCSLQTNKFWIELINKHIILLALNGYLLGITHVHVEVEIARGLKG